MLSHEQSKSVEFSATLHATQVVGSQRFRGCTARYQCLFVSQVENVYKNCSVTSHKFRSVYHFYYCITQLIHILSIIQFSLEFLL